MWSTDTTPQTKRVKTTVVACVLEEEPRTRDLASRNYRRELQMRGQAVLVLIVLMIMSTVLFLSPARATWAGKNGRIVFVSDRRDGNDDLYTMKPDGTGVRRVKKTASRDDNPSWSPNGRKIAYTCDPVGIEICKIDPNGKHQRVLTEGGGDDTHPSWSPSGRKLVFDSDRDGDGDYGIFKMKANGMHVTNLSDNPADQLSPTWFLKPNQITFNRYGDVYTMDPNGTDKEILIENDDYSLNGEYSPSGKRVIFSRYVEDAEIFRMRTDGSGVKQLTDNDFDDLGAKWSPNGKRIVFTRRIGGDGELFTMDRDGTHVRRLTNNDTDERQPDWQANP